MKKSVWKILIIVVMLVSLSSYGVCMATNELQRKDFPHADLTKISAKQLRHEVEGSKKFFEDLFGKSCQAIAFPFEES
ncbi:MAG: hypothetical protein H6Q68_1849 [Firmicutes bacterium]|nr:hypothetical protein [Bacillota bacterium]